MTLDFRVTRDSDSNQLNFQKILDFNKNQSDRKIFDLKQSKFFLQLADYLSTGRGQLKHSLLKIGL